MVPLSSAPTHLVLVRLLRPPSLFLATPSPPPLPLTLLPLSLLTWLPSPMVQSIPPPPHPTMSSDLNYLYVCEILWFMNLTSFPYSPTYTFFSMQSFPQAPTQLPCIQPFALLPRFRVPFPRLPFFPLPSPLSTFTPCSSSPPNLSSLSVCPISIVKLCDGIIMHGHLFCGWQASLSEYDTCMILDL